MERLRIHSVTTDQANTPTGVDLLNGPIRLARGTFQPSTTTEKGEFLPTPYEGQPTFEGFQRVVETLDLIGVGTPAELMAAEAEIQELLEQARQFFLHPTAFDSIWLEWTAEGEPTDTIGYDYGSKRALIYRGTLNLNMPDDFRGGFLDGVFFGRLVIERAPFWENVEEKNQFYTNTNGSFGSKVDISGLTAYKGTVPARLSRFHVYSFGYYETEFWAGIRSEGAGVTDFDPVWEFEDGTNGTDASDSSDGGASGGSKVVVSFATQTGLMERLTLSLGQAHAGSDYEHFMGRYLVLARVKVGSSTVCGLKMYYGYTDTPYTQQEEIFIDNTIWQLVELGELQIPPHRVFKGIYSQMAYLDDFTISIHAERISGSGSLDLDALCLIPADHLFTAKDFTDETYNPEIYLYTAEHGAHVFHVRDAGGGAQPQSGGEFTTRDWNLPTDASILVTAYQRNTAQHDLSVTSSVYVYYVPRWKLYRVRS